MNFRYSGYSELVIYLSMCMCVQEMGVPPAPLHIDIFDRDGHIQDIHLFLLILFIGLRFGFKYTQSKFRIIHLIASIIF